MNRRVLGPGGTLVFVALNFVACFTLLAFGQTWIQLGAGEHPVAFWLLSGILAVVVVNTLGRWALLPFMRRPVWRPPPPAVRVAVVTTYVPDAEPLAMLERTLSAMVGISGSHDTWVLDEGDELAVRRLCDGLGVRHFSRRHRDGFRTETGRFAAGTKHGNINAWLEAFGFDGYDFVVFFDSDHVPHADYLERTLGAFREESVAYVQSAQAYYNQDASLVARGAAEETYAYFSSVQMAAHGLGHPIIVGGHNAHRVEALQEVGGVPAHHADDLVLTLAYRAAGWNGAYVPEILARGLTPSDWSRYLSQQRRWARSVLDVKLRVDRRYTSRLPLWSRVLSLLHGLNYLHRSLVIPTGIGVLAWMLATGSRIPSLSVGILPTALVALATLQLLELFRQLFYLDPERERGFHWRVALLHLAKWPVFLLAGIEAAVGRRVAYRVTDKRTSAPMGNGFLALHGAIAIIITAGWIRSLVAGDLSLLVHGATASLLLGQVTLIVTEIRGFPPPFATNSEPFSRRPEEEDESNSWRAPPSDASPRDPGHEASEDLSGWTEEGKNLRIGGS